MKIDEISLISPKTAPIWPFLVLLCMLVMFSIFEVSMYGRQ